jgi:glycosyltransferase involved in cell wall biosynthesis
LTPRVSVIVPTRGRPQLVLRALRSISAQTLDDLEVRVVVDGPDPTTVAVLSGVADERVRVEVLSESRGPGGALNAGIAHATAPWVAFLDDDDEWMPDKLARQLAVAEAAPHAEPIVSCRFLFRDDRGDRVWPRRVPGAGEPISEYLFCRRSLSFGDGLLLTSTLFAPTALARRLPFDPSLPRHSDLDWVLRASGEATVGFAFADGAAPLAIWHADTAHERVSGRADWRFSQQWIERRRAEITPRAYASFLLTWVAANAVRQGERAALPGIALRALRSGAAEARALVPFLAIAALPRRSRESLSRWASSPGRQ